MKDIVQSMGPVQGIGGEEEGWEEEEDEFIIDKPISKSQTSITDLTDKIEKSQIHTLSSSVHSPSSITFLS